MLHIVKIFTASIGILAMLSTTPHAQETTTRHGISTFGDLKYSTDFKHFDYVNPDAPKGGTMSFVGTGASKTFDSLNPFILKGESAQGLGLLYDTLLVGAADETDSSYGLVAKTIEIPKDGTWVIFNMRPEARFADNTPLTAHDVVFSLEILQKEGHPVYRHAFKDIASAEALTDHKVKFTFKEGSSMRDLPSSVGSLPILPKHYYETHDFTKASMDIPLGSSGYKIAAAAPGKHITYCRIDDYWGKALPVMVGRYNFDCFKYEYFSDSNASFEGFKAGVFKFHEEFTSKKWATEYDFPAIRKGWIIKESIPDGRPLGTQGLWINIRKEKFQDPKLREALGYLFNFEWSNEKLFYGLYDRTDSFWENTDMQATGVPTGIELDTLLPYKDQLGADIFTDEPFSPPKLSAAESDRRAIRKASKLLDEAGWKIVNGKRQNDKGQILKIDIIDDGPAFERIINPIISNMKRVGIDAKLFIIDPAQMQERQKIFDYDIITGRLVMSQTPGEELANIFGTSGANSNGSHNFSGIADPTIDALILDISNAKDRETLMARVRALDRVLRSKHIWIPNWYKASHNIAYWDIFGRPEVKPKFSRGVLDLWWYDAEKEKALKEQGALK